MGIDRRVLWGSRLRIRRIFKEQDRGIMFRNHLVKRNFDQLSCIKGPIVVTMSVLGPNVT